jgi:hypothetical protein
MGEVPLYRTCGTCCQQVRCRANSAHIRQSRSDSGLGFQRKVQIFSVFDLRLEVAPAGRGRPGAATHIACPCRYVQGYLAHENHIPLEPYIRTMPGTPVSSKWHLLWRGRPGAAEDAASERRGNHQKHFEDVYLSAKARTWP